MTARKLAEIARDEIQTRFLLGEDLRAVALTGIALRLIATHHNSIPDEEWWEAYNSCFPKEKRLK